MKIALIHDDFSLWVFRRGLISKLIEKGNTVYAICPSGGYIHLLKEAGALHIPVEYSRFFNHLKDLKLFFNLYKVFRKEDFDIVHTFTIKPNIYGSLAARLGGAKKIILSVTGLGILKADEFSKGFKMFFLREILKKLYKLAAMAGNRVWFQNVDDMNFFISNKIISIDKATLIKSSGVNLEEFSRKSVNKAVQANLKQELNITPLTRVVTMVTRPLWNKGVKEFIEASEILKKKYSHVKFLLVGGIEEGNPFSVPAEYIEKKESHNFAWLGFRNEIRDIQAITDISVLPSYYAEGIPKNLLEAMAMGNPIITTNNTGCREVVEEGKNGYLVPIKNSFKLADAIEQLIADEKKSKEFGSYSRKKVETEFNEEIIVNRTINELYQMES
jgi:N,N'-diacetylbacillosaminyl-diphospho-undecaprenol alpha-1,3-N-acetylgalactosaminyltransferase